MQTQEDTLENQIVRQQVELTTCVQTARRQTEMQDLKETSDSFTPVLLSRSLFKCYNSGFSGPGLCFLHCEGYRELAQCLFVESYRCCKLSALSSFVDLSVWAGG